MSGRNEPSGSGTLEPIAIPASLWPALRSDHAGETGAVYIYRGILSVTRNKDVVHFARQHLSTEVEHLALMEVLVPPSRRSRALFAWRSAGWLTGALPALIGPKAVYLTIEAVETFVDRHYAAQTKALADLPQHNRLLDALERCRLDEIAHRDDARRHGGSAGPLGRAWCFFVDLGSRAGVAIASRI